MSNKTELSLHTVETTRGLDKMTRDVFAHEVPILERVHGFDAFRVVEEDADTKTVDMDPHAEYERLRRAFNTKQDRFVEDVYPSVDALARTLGIRADRSTSAAPKMAEVIVAHKKPKAKAGKSEKPAAK